MHKVNFARMIEAFRDERLPDGRQFIFDMVSYESNYDCKTYLCLGGICKHLAILDGVTNTTCDGHEVRSFAARWLDITTSDAIRLFEPDGLSYAKMSMQVNKQTLLDALRWMLDNETCDWSIALTQTRCNINHLL